MRRSLELADNSNIDPATSDSLFDEDGDLIEVKRQRIIPKEGEVTIEHALASNLEGNTNGTFIFSSTLRKLKNIFL